MHSFARISISTMVCFVVSVVILGILQLIIRSIFKKEQISCHTSFSHCCFGWATFFFAIKITSAKFYLASVLGITQTLGCSSFIIILFIPFDFINVFLSLILGQFTFIGYLGKRFSLLKFF